jgi:hypothetical protein
MTFSISFRGATKGWPGFTMILPSCASGNLPKGDEPTVLLLKKRHAEPKSRSSAGAESRQGFDRQNDLGKDQGREEEKAN